MAGTENECTAAAAGVWGTWETWGVDWRWGIGRKWCLWGTRDCRRHVRHYPVDRAASLRSPEWAGLIPRGQRAVADGQRGGRFDGVRKGEHRDGENHQKAQDAPGPAAPAGGIAVRLMRPAPMRSSTATPPPSDSVPRRARKSVIGLPSLQLFQKGAQLIQLPPVQTVPWPAPP